MKPGRPRGRDLRRAAYVVALALAAGAIAAPSPARAYAGGRFVNFGNVVDTGASDATTIASVDLNHDGNTDLVAPGPNNSLVSFLMQPNGQLQQTAGSSPALTIGSATGLATGSFNQDNNPDVVAVGEGPTSGGAAVEVLAGDNSGGFTELDSYDLSDLANPIPNTGNWLDVAVGDFDGNGTDDIAVLSFQRNAIAILLNNGHGGFTASSVTDTQLRPSSHVGVGDFDGDGNLDVVVAGGEAKGAVAMLLGNGRGRLSPAPGSPFTTKMMGAGDLVIGDVDRDGHPDVVVSGGGGSPGSLSILFDRRGRLVVGPGQRVLTPDGGPLALGYDRALHQEFMAVPDPYSDTTQVFLISRAGQVAKAPGSPYTTARGPHAANYYGAAITTGHVDGIPYLATEVTSSYSSTLINTIADRLKPSSTPPPSTLPPPWSRAVFSDPKNPQDIRWVEQTLVASAGHIADEAGGEPLVQASLYHLTDQGMAQSLVNAARRGASVQVVLDGSNRTLGCRGVPKCLNQAYLTLKQLNTLGRPSVWFKTCDGLGPRHPNRHVGRGPGCIGQARNHNKFLLVSEGDVPTPGQAPPHWWGTLGHDIVLQTSTNNTHASYYTAMNNALLTVNQPAVYDDYRNYFGRLATSYDTTKTPSVKRFAAKFGHHTDTRAITTHDIETWSFPQQHGADPILQALDNVRSAHGCATNSTQSSSGLRSGIALAMSRIDGREPVIKRLAALRQHGCNVHVLYAAISNPDRHILTAAGVGLHRVCLANPGHRKTPTAYVHDKYLLVAGTNKGLGPDRRIVYTGSDNLVDQALTHTDDRLMRYVETSQHSPVFNA
jgi:hypothetical protein